MQIWALKLQGAKTGTIGNIFRKTIKLKETLHLAITINQYLGVRFNNLSRLHIMLRNPSGHMLIEEIKINTERILVTPALIAVTVSSYMGLPMTHSTTEPNS